MRKNKINTCCIICAQERNQIQQWLKAPGFCISGYCSLCGYITATVVLEDVQ